MATVGKTNSREYLLESILFPNKAIAKGFGATVLLLDTGKVIIGIIKEEDDENILLISAAGESILVDKNEIEDRSVGLSDMPNGLKETLSKSDIRDLVEYLTTLQFTQLGGSLFVASERLSRG